MAEVAHVCGTGGFAGPLAGDPSSPLGLSAVGRYGYIELTWQMPTLNPGAVSYTVIYRSSLPQFSTATVLVMAGGNRYADPHGDNDLGTYHYWIRTLSIHGTPGELVGPASAAALPSIDQVLAGLAARIDAGFLATSLRAEIDRIGTLDLALAQKELDRLRDNEALSAALAEVTGELTTAKTLIQDEVIARTQGHTALVASLNTLATGVGENAAAIVVERNTRTTALDAVAQQFVTLIAQTSSNTSAIQQESIARANAMESLASELQSLIATSTNPEGWTASLLDERNARVSGDSSLAQQITSLETKTGNDLTAAIQQVNTTHTNSVTAQAQTNSTLSAEAAAKGKVIFSSTAPAAADRLAQNLWIDTTGGANTPKRWNGSAWVAVTDKVAVNAAAAAAAAGQAAANATSAIQNEQTARVNADNALSQSITTLESTMGSNLAQAQQQLQTKIDTTNGKVTAIGSLYTVKLNANGLVGGFGVYNDGSTVEAGFDVDTFWIGSTGQNKKKPFIIQNGTVYIDSAVISKISANQIDARGLEVLDTNGNVLLGSGKGIPAAYLPGLGINLIPNSDFSKCQQGPWGTGTEDRGGWRYVGNHLTPVDSIGVNLDVYWNLSGGHTLYLHQPGRVGDSQGYAEISTTGFIPVTPGGRYALSAYTGAHRCSVALFAYFYKPDGSYASQSYGLWSSNDEEGNGGNTLTGYKRQFAIAEIPADAALIRVVLRKYDTRAGYPDSWLFATMAQLEPVGGLAQYPGPWVPGNVSKMTSSNITTWIEGAAIGNAQIGGDIWSNNYAANSAGWIIRRDGYAEFSNMKARGAIMGGAFTGWGWPSGGGTGYYLGSEGLLLGNLNTGRYVQIGSEGNFYAPGLSIVNGVLTISALNVIGTAQIAGGAVTETFLASSRSTTANPSCSYTINVPAGQTWQITAIGTSSSYARYTYGGSSNYTARLTTSLRFNGGDVDYVQTTNNYSFSSTGNYSVSVQHDAVLQHTAAYTGPVSVTVAIVRSATGFHGTDSSRLLILATKR